MTDYNIDIEYPFDIDGNNKKFFAEQHQHDVLHQFEVFGWRQYRNLIPRSSRMRHTSFTVTNLVTTQTIRFTLLEYSDAEYVELMMESDLMILVPKKDLFGLITRRVKDYITFARLNLTEAKNCLNLFLDDDIETLELQYRNSLC